MQIVININENEYLGIKKYPNNITSYPITIHLYDAVRNGAPLPKGHGRLIDADALDGEWVCTYDGRHECERVCSCDDCPESEYQCYTDINDAPTIIEADKESEG